MTSIQKVCQTLLARIEKLEEEGKKLEDYSKKYGGCIYYIFNPKEKP